ncbi:phosphatase PAP2 family protein [Paractinoplanes durhamensis]|uniref:Inositolphosphotransferase Aur1/Ipt1 domain-containing protein n=1 Tax=Paractinoplanes durhamensis TaxID=113563 RepID=A0ABQ3YVN6_9ACTN|nr:phosphatase PAP2 family protein [Actinoplanes durhamensis]GIE01600.1 hypothetical protein Adu01nite_29500 [Actinoplanes durhamensis]
MSGKLARAVREILLVAALFLAYKLGRILVEGHVGESFTNAQTVWDLERLVHLPSEAALQATILGHTGLVRLANSYYAYVHFPATAATLIWLYLRRPEIYLWFRRTLASLTALALVTHALFPLAPPRMLAAAHLIDTGKIYGPSVYGSPSTDTLSNQYAAMPSLHVGWALAVAIALIAASRSRWRWLWLAHPITTLLVVVVTGNHYWLDAIAAVGLLAVVLSVVTPLSRSAEPAPAPTPQPAPRELPAPVAMRALPAPRLYGSVPTLAAYPLLTSWAQLSALVPCAPLALLLADAPQPEATTTPRSALTPESARAPKSAPTPKSTPSTAKPEPVTCVPRQRRDGDALTRPPISPAASRPGPSAPKSRSAPHR